MTPEEIENTEKEIEAELKEAAFWYDGWDNLRKVIDRLEDNDNEAAWERSQERLMEGGGYSASEEAERMYKIQRDLK